MIGAVHLEDAVHAPEIQAEAAAHGDDPAFHGGARPVGDDGEAVPAAGGQEAGDLVGGGGEGDGVGRLRVVVGGVPGAGLAVGGGGAQAVPEDLPQVVEERAGRGGAVLHVRTQIRQRNRGREKLIGISPALADRVPGRM